MVGRKGTYLVDGNDGIKIDEAKKVATENGVEPFHISLEVINLFRDKKSIVDYMYWFVDYENGSRKYIRFLDGMVEEDPFNISNH